MARTYREDIDWLRAIAVLSVLAFHWDIAPFRGGFVGVDIFFVISGFLITQIIQSDVGRGTFSFVHFYERRVRRLLPALYVLSAFAILPSFLYLLPSERAELFKSVAATVTFTSNIFFWLQSGYFGMAAEEKPMLHTWSLSVEEQFYLVLPVLIWALLKWRSGLQQRRTALLFGLGITAIASFAICYWLMKTGRTEAAFYLSPPRAWEFLVGSVIAIEGVPGPANIHFRRAARILGLVLIIIPVVSYRQGSIFPGVGALMPCFGATLFIWGGMGSAAPARAPWSPLSIANFIGRISYSLYLWHWPLWLYLRFSKSDLTIPAYQKALLFAVTVAVSYASYRYIEQPFRQRRLIVKRKAVFTAAACASVVLLCISVAGAFLSGRTAGSSSNLVQASGGYSNWYRAGVCFAADLWKQFNDQTCLTSQPGKSNVLIWGDSQAAQYIHGLGVRLGSEDVHFLQATGAGCLARLTPTSEVSPRCNGMQERMVRYFEQAKPDLVIIAGRWSMYTRDRGFDAVISTIQNDIAVLRKHGIPVVIIGPSPVFRSPLPAMLVRAQARGIEPRSDDLLEPGLFDLNDRMRKALPPEDGVAYVPMLDTLCPQRQCPLILDNRVALTFDHLHATTEGSVLMAEPVAVAARSLLRRDAGRSAVNSPR